MLVFIFKKKKKIVLSFAPQVQILISSLQTCKGLSSHGVCFLMETQLDKKGYAKHCRDVPFPNKFIVKKPNSVAN